MRARSHRPVPSSVLTLVLVAASAAAQTPEAAEKPQAKRWKYDVDVFFAPPETKSMGIGRMCHYTPKQGRIWLDSTVFFEHATDAYRPRTAHLVVVSDDLGLTWKPWRGPWPGSLTGRATLPDGSLVEVASGGYERYPKSELARLRKQGYSAWDVSGTDYCGIIYALWMRRSTDGGQTWTETPIHERIPFFAHLVPCRSPHVLNDGTLVAFAYGNRKRSDRSSCYMLRSPDAGETWSLVMMADGRRSPATEHIKELDWRTGFTEIFPLIVGRGRVFAMLRTQLGGAAFAVDSEDYGKTWSKPTETPIRAKHPEVTLLKDGTIVCTYQRRFARPFGVRARFTKDSGKTWSEEIILRDDISVSDGLSNPCTLELSDGTLFTAFAAKKLIDGVPRHFRGMTRWSRDPEREVAGESRWTRGYLWVPEIPVPPPIPKFNVEARGKSPWQVQRERDERAKR